MANEQNLRPIQKGQLSKEELKKRQSNGGKKSAQVRREKKTMQETAQMFLHTPLEDKDIEEFTSLKDFKGKNVEVITAAMAVVTQKALSGDMQALTFLRDTAGEKPVARVEVNADVAKAEADIAAKIAALRKRHGEQ